MFQLCLEAGVGGGCLEVNCHVFIATSARACKALDHCNPKHKLAVVVSSLVAHQIPAVVVCLFVWVF